jgi:hypothetical protein
MEWLAAMQSYSSTSSPSITAAMAEVGADLLVVVVVFVVRRHADSVGISL